MDLYTVTKTIHILSSTILFGTGIGIAFFMFRSTFTQELNEKFFAARTTVLADTFFTLPAVIIQPLSGIALIHLGGFNWDDFWLTATYAIYVLAGVCWIPVVWIQIQLKDMIQEYLKRKSELPERYHRLFKMWFLLGWPAFVGLVVVFYLMIAKPV